MLAAAREQQQQESTEQSDDGRLDMRERMREEAEDRQSEHKERAREQLTVLQGLPLVHLHDLRLQLRLRDHLLAVEDVHDEEHCRHAEDDDRREVLDEGDEGQFLDRVANHDVRRVADQRRRAADIRGKDLREQERHDRDVQLSGDGERNRDHQEDRRHIVEEGREQGRDEAEVDEQAARLRFRSLRRLDGDVVEESRLGRDAHEDHHTDEQAERIEVNVVQGRVHRHDAHDDHEDGAHHGDDRAVYLL